MVFPQSSVEILLAVHIASIKNGGKSGIEWRRAKSQRSLRRQQKSSTSGQIKAPMVQDQLQEKDAVNANPQILNFKDFGSEPSFVSSPRKS